MKKYFFYFIVLALIITTSNAQDMVKVNYYNEVYIKEAGNIYNNFKEGLWVYFGENGAFDRYSFFFRRN